MSDRSQPSAERQPRSFTTRQVIGIVVLLLVLIFALVNLEQVTVDFVVTQVTVPVFFVVTVPAMLGFAAGMLFGRGRSRPA